MGVCLINNSNYQCGRVFSRILFRLYTYAFTYDRLGRLTEADHFHGEVLAQQFTERGIAYDKTGNVRTMTRYENGAPRHYAYAYAGGRLQTVTQVSEPARYTPSAETPETGATVSAAEPYPYYKSGTKPPILEPPAGGFKLYGMWPVVEDWIASQSDWNTRNYCYDALGNMRKDYKNEIELTYNPLNLIENILQNGNSIAKYMYLADGTKLSATDAEGNGLVYAGSLVYKKTGNTVSLESSAFKGGRIIATANTFEPRYFITDHLGSVRTILDRTGAVTERNDYHPYGYRWLNAQQPTSENRYRYNGKEEQGFINLPYIDYGARQYDPKNRLEWNGTDVFAGKYPEEGVHVFCGSNPINRIDPDGRDAYQYNIATDEKIWINDIGGKDRQYVDLVSISESGAVQIVGSAAVNGANIYIGEVRVGKEQGWGVASVNLWDEMPSDLTGYKGYTYDMDDLKMRYEVRNGNSDVLKQSLSNFENQGIAEPLTATNYWNTYGQTLGALNLFGKYFNMMNDISGYTGGTQTSGRRFNNLTDMQQSGASNVKKPSIQEFNTFRSQHAGEFVGYKGRGVNTKTAWNAYLKAYGYK